MATGVPIQTHGEDGDIHLTYPGMKLYQVDWHLATARWLERDNTPARGVIPEAEQHRQAARELIKLTGYQLRERNL